MKNLCYILALIIMLLLVGSCHQEQLYPPVEPWLCSINADGTGFRKISKAPFGTPGLSDIFITKDEKIIFYADQLWISDTDVINPVQITPDDITVTDLPPRISQSSDGSKFYFAAWDKNIYMLTYPDYQITKLTNETVRYLRNPILSDQDNFLTYSSNGFGYPTKQTEYMYCMNLQNGESNIVATEDSVVVNGYYSEIQDFVFYERIGLRKCKLDGSESTIVDNLAANIIPYTMYSFSHDQQYVIRLRQLQPPLIRCFNIQTNSALELPVTMQNSSNPLGRLSKMTNKIFYIKPNNKLCVYDLDTSTNTVLFEDNNNISIYRFLMLSPTWDGSKVYFYAEISEG